MRRINYAALLGAFIGLTACAGGDADEQQPAQPASQPGQPAASNVELPEGVTAEMVAQGRQVFNSTVCFACHGMNGTGGPLGPAMTDQTWINIDGSFEQIVSVIQTGVQQPKEFPGNMPPMGGAQLTEEQVRAVAAYVYALSRGG